MTSRKNVLTAALKALLAGVETVPLLKIGGTFIAELASMSKDEKGKLDTSLPDEQFDKLMAHSILATSNATLAGVDTLQIKTMVQNSYDLIPEQLVALAGLQLHEFEDIASGIQSLKEDHGRIEEKVDKLITTVNEKHPSTPLPKAPVGSIQNIPYSPLGGLFKGREDDWGRLLEQMEDRSSTIAITQAIKGLGGIGKTRLAAEYGWHGLQNELYEVVLFVNCAQQTEQGDKKVTAKQKQESATERLAARMKELGARNLLAIDGIEKADLQTGAKIVLAELLNRDKWLLVFDNVDESTTANAVDDVIKQLLTSKGKIIVTSRLEHLQGTVRPLPLKKLSEEASVNYLLEKTGLDDREHAKKTATLLDGLPVALEQAAAYIVYLKISFKEYLLDFIEIEGDVLGFRAQAETLIEYPVSVLKTWWLTEQKLSSIAKAVQVVASFLSPNAIPKDVLLKQSQYILAVAGIIEGVSQEKFDSIINGAGDKRAVRNAIAELAGYSMISRDVDGDSFSIHRLVQEVTRLRLAEEHKVAFTKLVLVMVAKECPNYDTTIKTHYAWHRKMDSHLSGLIAYIGQLWPKVNDIPKTIVRNLTTQINNLAQLYQATNHLAEAEPLLLRALEILENPDDDLVSNYAGALNNLAQLYKATNRLAEAESLMNRALAIAEKTSGKNHPNVAVVLNNLAQLYQATNHLAEAEPLMERVLAIDKKVFGKDHPNVARDLNNLALLYQATNRLAEAEPLMLQALAIVEKAFGKDHPNVANDINNLAVLYMATHRLAKAEPLAQRALAIDEKALGKDHPNVARDLNNLAQLYLTTHHLAEAEPLMERALAIDEKALGKDHPEVATDLNNLAQLYMVTHRQTKAEPLMERVVDIFEKAYGKNHPNVATALNNLAKLYKASHRLTEAKPLMERMVGILIEFTRKTGHPHPHLQTAINNYSGLLEEVGHTKEDVATRIKSLAPGAGFVL